MEKVSGRNQWAIRRALLAKGLAIKAKDRRFSYDAYLARQDEVAELFAAATTEPKNATIIEDKDTVYRKLDVAERALQRARDELNYRRATMRSEVRSEDFEKKIEDLVTKSLGSLVINVPSIPKVSPYSQEYGLIAVLSDIHLGEIVGDDVPDNEYNYKIAKQRTNQFIQSIISNPKQSRKIIVTDLKDVLKGVIHNGIYESEDSFIDSINIAVGMYVDIYLTLSAEYEELIIYSTGSNHDRIFDNVTTTDKHLDYGRLIDMMVTRILNAAKIDNITIRTTENGYHMFKVNGANIAVMHGDTLRNYKPYVEQSRAKLQDTCLQIFNEPYRHAISGHTHSFVACANQYGGMNVVNGTMVGNTSYGLQSGYGAITPSQTILYVEDTGAIEDIKSVQFST
jgi:hypothetical protein